MLRRSRRAAVVVLVVAAALGSTAPSEAREALQIRVVWDVPMSPPPLAPHFDCGNRAWAANNPDKCGLSGPFLLGGGAPTGGGLLGGLLKRLGGLL
jgi:hypothetical protein